MQRRYVQAMAVVIAAIYVGAGSAVACMDDSECEDGNICTMDVCDPLTGCTNDNVLDGTPCSDNSICNGYETCQSGVCTAGMPAQCNDHNPCTVDPCDPLTGCRNDAVPDGTSCEDGVSANGAETCQGGVCTAGVPLATPLLSFWSALALSGLLILSMTWRTHRRFAPSRRRVRY